MIYTLDYLLKEATKIQGAWNGEDEYFMYDGDRLPAEAAEAAGELIEKLDEVTRLVNELSL